VRAGGGVLWRRRPDGRAEVLVVHRPRYDDWSFPKGKFDPALDADDLACARREVAEETGLDVAVGEELAPIGYVDNRGRDKVVRYWLMEVVGGEFTRNGEVDVVVWVDPDDASPLSYAHDRSLLARARDRLG